MSKDKPAYDQRCYELAKAFLKDVGITDEVITEDLAVQIQETIEKYIETELP